MALTPDYQYRIIHSDASILDMVAFHMELRELESSLEGMLSPPIHTYKEVPLGGGSIFPAVAFINSWRLQFPAGNFEVNGGNLTATIVPVAGCYVKQTQSAAYAVTTIGGGSGLTQGDIHAVRDSVLDAIISEHTVDGSLADTLKKALINAKLAAVLSA